MSLSLADLGWHPDPHVESLIHSHPGLRPARVTRAERGAWLVHDGAGELLARGHARPLDDVPVTGDWVLISGDERSSCYVEVLLPRRTTLSRAEAGRRKAEQVLAANVDVVALCAAAGAVNHRRLDRELTAVWESGATPLVVVTKADTIADPDDEVDRAAAHCLGVDVVAVSSVSGEGVAALRARIAAATTLALIGPSGVGKSSLVNALAGHEVLATADTRSDGKGRHTTTSRHLVPLPSGGLLLDTPGMREFAPWVGDEGLQGTFADIDELASHCRFSDCGHDSEPGCAVVIAAASDEEVGKRLDSWWRLQREQAWLERRHDARLMAQERRRWAIMSKSARSQIRP